MNIILDINFVFRRTEQYLRRKVTEMSYEKIFELAAYCKDEQKKKYD